MDSGIDSSCSQDCFLDDLEEDPGEGQAILWRGATGAPETRRLLAMRYALIAAATLAFAGAVAVSFRRSSTLPRLQHPPEENAALVVYEELLENGPATTWTSTTSLPFRQSSKDLPSLFCWLVSQTVGGEKINRKQGWWEEKLVWEQFMQKVGLFACNEFAVFTDYRCKISEMGPWGWPYVDEDYEAKDGDLLSWGLGQTTETAKNGDSSPSNTWVFVAAWKALGSSGVLEKHNWVVKQDPDAVVLPWRIRWHASQWGNTDGSVPIFIKNCQTFGSMQGPLEVFSIALVRLMIPQIDTCGENAAGEDSKMEKCAQQFGQQVMDVNALDDKYCLHRPPICSNGNMIAFHPFKEIPNFRTCTEEAIHAEKVYAKNHPDR